MKTNNKLISQVFKFIKYQTYLYGLLFHGNQFYWINWVKSRQYYKQSVRYIPSYTFLTQDYNFGIGVRERLARTLVQDTGVGEPDGPDVVGGEEGALAALLGQVWRPKGLLQVSNVRRELHGDNRFVAAIRRRSAERHWRHVAVDHVSSVDEPIAADQRPRLADQQVPIRMELRHQGLRQHPRDRGKLDFLSFTSLW